MSRTVERSGRSGAPSKLLWDSEKFGDIWKTIVVDVRLISYLTHLFFSWGLLAGEN